MSYSPFPSHGGVVGPSAPYHRAQARPEWLPAGAAPYGAAPFGQSPGIVSALTSAGITGGGSSSWLVPALIAGAAVLLFWGTLGGGGTRRNRSQEYKRQRSRGGIGGRRKVRRSTLPRGYLAVWRTRRRR